MTYFLTSSPFGVGSPYLNPANGFIEKLREELVSPCAAVFVCSDPNRYDFTDHIAMDMKKALEAAGFAFSSFDILDGRNMEQTAVLVKKAGLIVLAGGHVPTQKAFLNQCGLKDALPPCMPLTVSSSASARAA